MVHLYQRGNPHVRLREKEDLIGICRIVFYIKFHEGVVLLARKKRFWFPGAIFHITARGNRRQNIFLNDTDRVSYLGYLKEVKEVHRFKLHAYCLMSNHVHLIIEINHSPPSAIL
ncbi:hypothetical protein GLV98_19790 [Halobacillus litoralis]|uniref:Transposase IS200-like domain-containing protein n=1 Tax=Halobacillus litoralis TaxID=45668 RepID=A0A845E7G1_9BACI|nr:hypothetical protein [Halobacillus litoralis]